MVEEKTYRLNMHKRNINDLIDLGYLPQTTPRPLEDDATLKEVIGKINEMLWFVTLSWNYESKHIRFEETRKADLYKHDDSVAIAEVKARKKTTIENSS